MKDPKYLNIPNINFSITKKSDEREKRFSKQREKIGFDDSETWNLDSTMSRFIYPRLKRYLKINIIAWTEKEKKDLKLILKVFKMLSEGSYDLTKEDNDLIEKGLKKFSK